MEIKDMATLRQTDRTPSIAVLMGTFNGARFLREQLQSIVDQTVGKITLYVSDDGSSDDTLAIVDEFASTGRLEVVLSKGPGKGFAENYRILLGKAAETHDAYMFADQDDIWHLGKIKRSLAQIAGIKDGPAGVGGRTQFVSEDGTDGGFSRLFQRAPSFRNALVQSIAGGNTILLNPEGFRLTRDSSRAGQFVSHDWWAYLIITGAGGRFVYDAEATISYRQHANNLVGANTGLSARLRRIRKGMAGTFQGWNTVHINLLVKNESLLTPQSRAVLDNFRKARSGHLLGRLIALRRSGVYHQTVFFNFSLLVACVLAKL
jgi:glycosyltransferase involved in cell wall biosynthesis